MASIKLLLNKDQIHKDGTFPLVFQIIHRRKKNLYIHLIEYLRMSSTR